MLARILAEYLQSLRWREYVLRRGRAALIACSRGSYPGHDSLAPLFSLLGGMARRIEREGEVLRFSDPALWLLASRFGVERAARELREASKEVREADESKCRDIECIDHAIAVTTAAWRDTLTALSILARRLQQA